MKLSNIKRLSVIVSYTEYVKYIYMSNTTSDLCFKLDIALDEYID